MRDYNKYVGIPWVCGEASIEGADCWGIVTMVYSDVLGIDFGHYALSSIDSTSKVIRVFSKEMDKALAAGIWEKTDNPEELDVVMIYSKSSRRPDHVGIYIGDGMILHSMTRDTGISEIHHSRIIAPMFERMEYYRYVR